MKKILMILGLIAGLSSCSKDSDDNHENNPDDVVPPTIAIMTPTNNPVYNSGTTVTVTGRVTDDKGLYRGTVRIVNDASGAVVKEQSFEIHGFVLFDFNVSQAISVTSATNFTATVKFEDHGSNENLKSEKFSVIP